MLPTQKIIDDLSSSSLKNPSSLALTKQKHSLNFILIILVKIYATKVCWYDYYLSYKKPFKRLFRQSVCFHSVYQDCNIIGTYLSEERTKTI